MLPSARTVAPWKRLGKVALGKRAEKGNPLDLDYFIFKEKNPSDAKYYPSKRYHERLGDTPRELNIILPYPTVEQTLRDRAVMYGSNGLRQCYSDDAVRAQRRRKIGEKMEWHEIACPYMECEFKQSRVVDGKVKPAPCKDKAIFTFMVPAASDDTGTFYMDFGSRVAASNIHSTLTVLADLCEKQGRPQGIFGIRCKLVREATAFDVDGRRIIKHIPTIHVDFASLMQRDKLLLGEVVGMKLPGIGSEPPLQIAAEEAETLNGDTDE